MHPNEAMVREALSDFSADDLDRYWARCAEDFVLHIPGSTRISGAYAGKDGYYGLLAEVIELTTGTFEETVLDVIAGDNHAAVLSRHQLVRNDKRHDYRTVHFYELRGRRLGTAWELPQDLTAFHEAWQ